MKSNKWLLPIILLFSCSILGSLVCFAFAASNQSTDWLERYQNTMEKEALSIAGEISDIVFSPQYSVDAIEEHFIQQGLPVLDSQENCPSWLANPAHVYSFWEKVQSGKDAELKYLSVHKNGILNYTALHYQNNVGTYVCACIDWDDQNKPFVSMWETHTIQDMELSENGNFYYRIRPANDKHYVDYCMLRLEPPDPELWQMTNRYICPIGYYSVNIFLCDWDEQNYGELSLTDLLEYLYLMDHNETLPYEKYPSVPVEESFLVPASIFERTILSHFRISKDLLHERCRYNADDNSYPWTPFYTNDAVQYWFPYVDPEVIAKRDNPDGTFTLTVNVSSADLKADTVFVHEVTIRPTGNNGFQYVSNRIVSQTEYGMPNKQPRFFYRNK